MNTLLFEETDICNGGFIEYGARHGGLFLKYSIKFKINTDSIFKLVALSSEKPFNVPIVADTIEIKNLSADSQREISHETLVRHGYLADDADTFVLVQKCPDGSWGTVATRCFGGNVWNADNVFEAGLTTVMQTPAQRGKQILNSIKELTKCRTPQTAKKWAEAASLAASSMEKAQEAPVAGYEWYISHDIRPPVALSAYRHLLYVAPVINCFERYGAYLFGLAGGGRTALAVRSDGANPFINADDCATKVENWWVVGIYLGDDGQYFEKIQK